MKIETKYEIGQHIWIVYEYKGEVHVYEDEVMEICLTKKGIVYFPKFDGDELEESEIILYEDTEKLVNKIKEVMEEIKKNEKNV